MKQESENTDVIEKVVNGLFEKINKTENHLASLIIKLKKGRQKTEGRRRRRDGEREDHKYGHQM